MHRRPRRTWLALAGVGAAAFLVVAAPAASAAPIPGGMLAVQPDSGRGDTAAAVQTNKGCRNADGTSAGTNYQVQMFGPGFPADNARRNGGYNVTANIAQPSDNTAPINAPLLNTFANFAAAQTPPATLNGDYELRFICRPRLTMTNLGDFSVMIRFTPAGSGQNIDATYVTIVPAATTTTTSLAASPASPQPPGTAVTLTATVSPTSAAGSVQFKNGTANLGAPVQVSGGTASTTVSNLPTGTNSLTAVFTPTDGAAFTSSTSNTVAYQVVAPAQTTTTTLASSAASGTQGDNNTLTATVSPTAAVGSVQFKDGDTVFATVAVSNGSATTSTSPLKVGARSLTASFVPANAADFGASTSSVVSYTVTARPTTTAVSTTPVGPAVESTEVTITATVNPVVAGTVQFQNGGVNLGVTSVDPATGKASISTTSLPVGSNSLTAIFTPADTTVYGGSTSPARTYTVTAATPGGGSAIATTTTLAISPAPPQPQGTAVTLTATLTPSAAGTVAFFDGSTSVGSAPVSGGKASITTSALPAGDRALRAVYTPTNANAYQTSTSATVAYRITVPTATTTTLVVTPASPQVRGTSLTLTATVTPASAVGSVQFLDGTTVIGTSPVSAGRATLTVASPTTGTRSFTARFLPANTGDFTGSVSAAVAFVTTAPIVVPPSGIPCQIVITPAGRKTAVPRGCVPFPANLTPCTFSLDRKTGRKGSMPKGCLPTPKTQTFCSVVVDRNGRKGVLPKPCVPVRSFLPGSKIDVTPARSVAGRLYQ